MIYLIYLSDLDRDLSDICPIYIVIYLIYLSVLDRDLSDLYVRSRS